MKNSNLNGQFLNNDYTLKIEGIINYFLKNKEFTIKNFEMDDQLLNYSVKKQSLEKFFKNQNQNFQNILEKLYLNKHYFKPKNIIERNIVTLLHPEFLNNYVPIKTPPDGNCLFHMVLMCLFGHCK